MSTTVTEERNRGFLLQFFAQKVASSNPAGTQSFFCQKKISWLFCARGKQVRLDFKFEVFIFKIEEVRAKKLFRWSPIEVLTWPNVAWLEKKQKKIDTLTNWATEAGKISAKKTSVFKPLGKGEGNSPPFLRLRDRHFWGLSLQLT